MFHNKNICRLFKVYHPNFTGYHSKKILCFYSSFPLYYFLQGQKCVNKKEGPSFFLKGITFLCRLLNSKPESCNKEHAFLHVKLVIVWRKMIFCQRIDTSFSHESFRKYFTSTITIITTSITSTKTLYQIEYTD